VGGMSMTDGLAHQSTAHGFGSRVSGLGFRVEENAEKLRTTKPETQN